MGRLFRFLLILVAIGGQSQAVEESAGSLHKKETDTAEQQGKNAAVTGVHAKPGSSEQAIWKHLALWLAAICWAGSHGSCPCLSNPSDLFDELLRQKCHRATHSAFNWMSSTSLADAICSFHGHLVAHRVWSLDGFVDMAKTTSCALHSASQLGNAHHVVRLV